VITGDDRRLGRARRRRVGRRSRGGLGNALPTGTGSLGLAAGATLTVRTARSVVLDDCRRRVAAISSVPGVLLAVAGLRPAVRSSAGSPTPLLGCASDPGRVVPALTAGVAIVAVSAYVALARR